MTDLSRDIEARRRDLKTLEEQQERIQRACRHQWEPPVYDPIIHNAYTVPEFKQGSDFSPEMHIPRREEPRWRRHCPLCDKTEYTMQSEEHVQRTYTPKFP